MKNETMKTAASESAINPLPPDELIAAAKEIVADGCGCDRQCEKLLGLDICCGCESDAKSIIAIAQAPMLEALRPLAGLPVGPELFIDDESLDTVLYKNAGKCITARDVMNARAAIAKATQP